MVAARKTAVETPAAARTGAPRGPSRDEIAAYHLIDEMRLVGGLIERAV